jgi:atypical dual specificity phosphatase
MSGPSSEQSCWWHWIVPGQLIAAPAPERIEGAATAWSQTLRSAAEPRALAILNLREVPDPGMPQGPAHSLHLPIEDFSVPTVAQVDQAIAFIVANLAADRVVVVHCLGGCGRTGTVLASYLKTTEGLGAQQAIAQLRTISSCFVETAEQERFVEQY